MNDFNSPSKSRLKREHSNAQALGRELIAISDNTLVALELEATLLDAIRAGRSLKRSALQRQLKYIGGLLIREDLDALRSDLEQLQQPQRDEVARFHLIEQWRDELLRDGEVAIERCLNDYPKVDSGQLRQLLRDAEHEQNAGKPPRAARKLFSYLSDVLNDAN